MSRKWPNQIDYIPRKSSNSLIEQSLRWFPQDHSVGKDQKHTEKNCEKRSGEVKDDEMTSTEMKKDADDCVECRRVIVSDLSSCSRCKEKTNDDDN